MNLNNKRNKLPNNLKEHKINRAIRANYVYLIDSDSEKGRNISFDEALSLASYKGMDLVQIAVNSEGPICKIMDYGKFCFEKNKNKVKLNKNEQKIVQISLNIHENDLMVKLKQTQSFLKAKQKVQVVLKMQGRQADYPDLALAIFDKFIAYCSDDGKVDSPPKIDGRKGFLNFSAK